MFWNCCNLIEIDLSSFNFSNLIGVEEIFLGCYKLKILKINEEFKSDFSKFKNKYILK